MVPFKRTKIALIMVMGMMIGGIGVLLWINLQEKRSGFEAEEPLSKLKENIDQQLERIRFVEERGGRTNWELEAKKVHQVQKDKVLILEGVKLIYYSKDGHTFTLSGDQGKVFTESKDMELSGNVVLTMSNGYRLNTRSLFYHHSEKKVTSSDPIELEGKEIRLTGQGMWVNFEKKTFNILHQVKSRWKGEKG
ncbi:MAG: LPS export ABC transporter periplasmic protein LptC [Thermodesulfobacteriota bacterium]